MTSNESGDQIVARFVLEAHVLQEYVFVVAVPDCGCMYFISFMSLFFLIYECLAFGVAVGDR